MAETIDCINCDTCNPIANKYCGGCGNPITLPVKGESLSISEQPARLECPVCQYEDRIVKVRGIVSGQTRVSGLTINRSELATHLTPPVETEEMSLGETVAPLMSGATRIVSCLGMVFFGLIALAVFGFGGGGWGLIPLGMTVLMGWGAFSKDQKSPEQLQEDRRKQLRWKIAMDRWDSSFYCGRCDVVFVENETHYTAPENFYTLLYPQDL